MKYKYISIEKELIDKYKIVIVCKSNCWSRTHAHTDGTRRICKWNKMNSINSLFTLAHEIGHIMTYKTKMRRCESEFNATVWALQELDKYNIQVPINIIDKYQRYINMEFNRGLRRGANFNISKDDLNISNYKYVKLNVKKVTKPKEVKHKPLRVEL